MNIAIRTEDYNDCHFAMDSNGRSAMQIRDIKNPYTSSINVFIPYEEWDCLSGCISLAAEIGKHYEMSYPEIYINWIGPWNRQIAGLYAYDLNSLGQPYDYRDPTQPENIPNPTPMAYYNEYKKDGSVPFAVDVTFRDSIKPIEEPEDDTEETTETAGTDTDTKDIKKGKIYIKCGHCGKLNEVR